MLGALLAGTVTFQSAEAAGGKEGFTYQQSKAAQSGETVKVAGMQWYTDLGSALAQAKKSNRPVFLLGTGSDWCGFCIRLEKNVLKDKAFQKYAEDNLVLLYVDSPRRKKQSAAVASHAKTLLKQFKINGFPTVVLLAPDGRELGRKGGYGGVPAQKYVDEIKAIVNK